MDQGAPQIQRLIWIKGMWPVGGENERLRISKIDNE